MKVFDAIKNNPNFIALWKINTQIVFNCFQNKKCWRQIKRRSVRPKLGLDSKAVALAFKVKRNEIYPVAMNGMRWKSLRETISSFNSQGF